MGTKEESPTLRPTKIRSAPRHATWLELFFDLVFVAAIGPTTHILSHAHHGHISGMQIFEFLFSFIPIWWIWASHTYFSNRFENDSRSHRLATLSIMFLFAFAAAFFGHGLLKGSSYLGFISIYCLIRLIQALMHFGIPVKTPAIKSYSFKMMVLNFFSIAVVMATSRTTPLSLLPLYLLK